MKPAGEWREQLDPSWVYWEHWGSCLLPGYKNNVRAVLVQVMEASCFIRNPINLL